MGTLAPYAIDNYSFVHMMGDCFEIVARAASGYAVGEIDELGNVVEWVEAPPEERVKDAEYAFNKLARESIRLLCSGLAIERTVGAECMRDSFEEYTRHYEELSRHYEEAYEAAKVAAEYELGLDREE